eukprot:752594-Hanusia_phi.AAC.2
MKDGEREEGGGRREEGGGEGGGGDGGGRREGLETEGMSASLLIRLLQDCDLTCMLHCGYGRELGVNGNPPPPEEGVCDRRI